MRELASIARVWTLLALALFASAEPLLAQEASSESSGIAPSSATPRERARQRIQRVRGERARIVRQAPAGFENWLRELPPLQQRRIDRRLRVMPEAQRERFFRDWGRMSLRDRQQLAERVGSGDARRRRELPPRLRTPEMRERLVRMSPEERRDFFARARDWRDMDVGERRRMRARLEKFGGLSEEKQQALVDEQFKRRSPEQRAKILNDLREASQQMRKRRGGAEASAPLQAAPEPPAAN